MTKQEKQINHIAKLIERELGFTNGWHISDEQYTHLCSKASSKIHKYLSSKASINQPLKLK